MKTLHYFVRGYLLVLVLLIGPNVLAQNRNAVSCPPANIDFSNEFEILVNSGPFVIGPKEIKRHKRMFKNRVKFRETLVQPALKIPGQTFISKLYCEAEVIRTQAQACNGTTDCITGVWMIHGVKDGKLTYFFQPAALQVQPVSAGDTTRTFTPIGSTGEVYEYVEAASRFEPNPQWQDHQKAYFHLLRVRRHWYTIGRHKTNHGDNVDDWKLDAEKVFYSFREILNFLAKHYPDYSGDIYVNNSAANFGLDPKRATAWRTKHNTFITVGKDNKIIEAKAISDDAANLAHVCPSRCNDLEYPGTVGSLVQPRTQPTQPAFKKQNKRKN